MDGYVRDVLEASGKLGAQGPRRAVRHLDRARCAYCQGTGVDPKYGNVSQCPCCAGAGDVDVGGACVSCLRCSATGRDTGDLSCVDCRGAGVVPVRPDAGTCRRCGGSGYEGVFYCAACQGHGVH